MQSFCPVFKLCLVVFQCDPGPNLKCLHCLAWSDLMLSMHHLLFLTNFFHVSVMVPRTAVLVVKDFIDNIVACNKYFPALSGGRICNRGFLHNPPTCSTFYHWIDCIQVMDRGLNHGWFFGIEYVCCQGFDYLESVVWLGLCSRDALRLEVISKFALNFQFDPGGGCNCNNSSFNCKFYHGYGRIFCTSLRKVKWMMCRIFGLNSFDQACMVSLHLAPVLDEIYCNVLTRILFVTLVGACDIPCWCDFRIWDELVGTVSNGKIGGFCSRQFVWMGCFSILAATFGAKF